MDDKLKEIHEAYLLCQKVFAPSTELFESLIDISDEREACFCRIASDFFLQKKQEELIK